MAFLTHLLGHPLRFALSTLKITCLAHLTLTHLVQVSTAQGPSMLPTFSVDGDWIAADMTARRGRGIGVGDLVLYRIPLFASQNGVKRVVGMPGDFVSLGTPGEPGEERTIQACFIRVPEGHCWIVGDNLPASRDSRQFGPLPLALVQGKIVAKVLPWRERHWIQNGLERIQDGP
ncbi:Mitochondrial inner membrane protease subunit 1 [Tolypocladium ophioglossoides CBS 100239]|uniref:Mitochondrial inner membrane protease subunit 1 n=1 Tax=Tolypocladium ophioglossoides (strain CBS 100239) TaxID=1163406 RepID=A0A0L0MYY3_TOLOC|nr:Mitochondrial inner membrane protease subunit 1 [Tolypocladium ophioglossoides CBS 100239]